jgi:hypothetical protein
MGASGLAFKVKDSPRRLFRSKDPLSRYFSYFHKHLRRRSSYRGYSCTVTIENLFDMYHAQSGLCAITHIPMTIHRDKGQWHTYNVSVDRIDNAIGYDLNNIQLVCQHINIMRGTLTIDQFLELCREIVRRTSND